MSGFVIKLNVLSALCSTIWNNINDCDETFNYLEPLGFISSISNNTGFQTWEYSPEFGLRSYFYLWLVGWPAFLLNRLNLPGWSQLLAIRLILSVFSAFSISSLTKSASQSMFPNNQFKKETFEILFTILHCVSPATFISASSTVPSAVAASMTSLMLSAWISGKLFYSVGAVAFSAIVLWPFSACLGIPLALSLIFSGNVLQLIWYSAFWLIVIVPPLIMVDSLYYGRLICPPLNIIAYNALSAVRGHSFSQLYGVEPASYYIKNYILNYNVAFVVLLLLAPTIFVYFLFQCARKNNKASTYEATRILLISAAPLGIWNLVFFLQAHKEERFMFPCYPCLELLVALVLCLALNRDPKKQSGALLSNLILTSFSVCFALLSISRIVALIQGYSAPMYLTQHLPSPVKTRQTLCMGRDWHHFPSHFLLPQEAGNAWRVHFLRSNFSGQLPGKFFEGEDVLKATRVPHNHFNDKNLPEEGTYFDVNKCDYILDRFSKPGNNEAQYSDDAKTWRVLARRPILERNDAVVIGMTTLKKALNHFRRAFYLPGLFKSLNTWVDMHILERVVHQ